MYIYIYDTSCLNLGWSPLSTSYIHLWDVIKDLDKKYKDEATVKDLIERKTAGQQFESNPDFPEREELLMKTNLYVYVINIYQVFRL